MMAPYRRVLATPGALGFSASGFVGRLPISMLSLGVVILVQHTTGSYGVAGAVAGVMLLSSAVAAPLVSRWADMRGQSLVLPPVVLLQAATIAALVACCALRTPHWVLYAVALLVGLPTPSIGSLVRARWSHVLSDDDTDALHTAYSLESVLDELVFIVGPLIVTVLATSVSPSAGLLVAAGFALAGGLSLAAQSRTEPPTHERETPRGPGVLRTPGMVLVILILTCTGGAFGSVEVVLVALTREEGAPRAAGPLLALWALGSLVAGLLYGAVQWRVSLTRRLLVSAGAFAAGMLVLPLAPSLRVLAGLLLVTGAVISPVIIGANALIQRLAPQQRLTEALTWGTTGLVLAYGVSAAVAGRIIDAHGARPAFLVAGVSGALTFLVAAAGYRRLQHASGGALAGSSRRVTPQKTP